jgi:DNA polymerase III subunit beta
MKITAPKKTLSTALSRIQGIAEKSSIKPIISNALIHAGKEGISVSATNLQIGMRATYQEVKVEKEGTISVNARKLYEIVKELPEGEITLTEKENYKIEITCGKDIKFNIIGLPPEDFPVFIKEEDKNFIKWETEKILEMLYLTAFSISRDEANPSINGAYLENIEGGKTRMVSTDGYRLSIADEELEKTAQLDEGILIPHKAVIELNRILLEKKEEKNIFLLANSSSLLVKTGEVEFYIRLIDKKFPDYKVIVPGDGYKKIEVCIEKEKLRSTLKRMSIISNENNRPVVFLFKGKKAEIFTEDSELGNVKESIDLKDEISDSFKFCINCSYLLDIINVLEEDILIEFNAEEENKPIIVKSAVRKNIKYIIMPMLMD